MDPPTAAIGKGGPSRTPVPILDLGDASSSDVAGDQRIARQVEVGDVIAAAAAALEQVGMGLSNREPVPLEAAARIDELQVAAGDAVESELDLAPARLPTGPTAPGRQSRREPAALGRLPLRLGLLESIGIGALRGRAQEDDVDWP